MGYNLSGINEGNLTYQMNLIPYLFPLLIFLIAPPILLIIVRIILRYTRDRRPKANQYQGEKRQVNGKVDRIEKKLLTDQDQSYTGYRLHYQCQDGTDRVSIWHYGIDDPLAVLIKLGKVEEGSAGTVVVQEGEEGEIATGFRVGLKTNTEQSQ